MPIRHCRSFLRVSASILILLTASIALAQGAKQNAPALPFLTPTPITFNNATKGFFADASSPANPSPNSAVARIKLRSSRNYTSARLKTQGKFAQALGRFEARIKIPHGQGSWPAFWMLGDDIDQAAWPTCGEIDIMENIGKEPSMVHGTIHGPGYSGDKGIGASFSLPTGPRFADDFHIFAVEWEPKSIRF
jgi:beta-glucanase (GH16 family)